MALAFLRGSSAESEGKESSKRVRLVGRPPGLGASAGGSSPVAREDLLDPLGRRAV